MHTCAQVYSHRIKTSRKEEKEENLAILFKNIIENYHSESSVVPKQNKIKK